MEQGSSGESDDLWVVYAEGSSNCAGSKASLLLLGSEGFVVEYILRFDLSATNNEAEYETLIVRLRIIRALRVQKLRICTNSQQVAGQMKEDFEDQEENIKKYLQKVKDLTLMFVDFDIYQVP